MKKLILVGILAFVMGVLGCAGEKKDTAPQPEVASTPVDIFAIQTKWLTDFAIGSELGPDGAVSISGNTFAPGDTIYYSASVGEAPPASAVKAVWVGPNAAKLGEEMKGITAGQKKVSFQAPDTAAWAPGTYEAQIWVVDEKVNSERFQIPGEDAATPTAPAPATKTR